MSTQYMLSAERNTRIMHHMEISSTTFTHITCKDSWHLQAWYDNAWSSTMPQWSLPDNYLWPWSLYCGLPQTSTFDVHHTRVVLQVNLFFFQCLTIPPIPQMHCSSNQSQPNGGSYTMMLGTYRTSCPQAWVRSSLGWLEYSWWCHGGCLVTFSCPDCYLLPCL